MITESGQNMYQSGVLYGPFELSKGNGLYNARVSIIETKQKFSLEWESFRLLLIPRERLLRALNNQVNTPALKALFDEVDAIKEPLECYSFNGDFWDEEGYDDEGHWHENDLSVDDDFVLEKPGVYYAFLELTSQKPRDSSSVGLNIERVKSYRYYIIIMVILAGLAFFNKAKARTFNAMSFKMAE